MGRAHRCQLAQNRGLPDSQKGAPQHRFYSSTLREWLRQHPRCGLISSSGTGVSGLHTHATRPTLPSHAGGQWAEQEPPTTGPGGVARSDATPSHSHWLRLPRGRSQRTPWADPEAPPWVPGVQVREKLVPAPRKPGPQAMGGQLRLPPGEPCREGECQAWWRRESGDICHCHLGRWEPRCARLKIQLDPLDPKKMWGFLTRSPRHSGFPPFSRLPHRPGSKY